MTRHLPNGRFEAPYKGLAKRVEDGLANAILDSYMFPYEDLKLKQP